MNPAESRTIWNSGMLGWVSLAVLALMLFVVSEVMGMRHDLEEIVISQSDDSAKVHAEVQHLRIAIRELQTDLQVAHKIK